MKIPTREQAEALLHEAETRHPGPWAAHSRHAARAAEAIGGRLGLDPEAAYVMGLLHDIGRYVGVVTDMRHVLDGYNLLMQRGYPDAARICLTHSFPLPNVQAVAGKWDCTPGEMAFIEQQIADIEFTPYDRLVQLCDALALPQGCCLIEKRLMDVALRHGVNEYSVPRWQVYLAIREDFERQMGVSIYSLLPEVVEVTFEG